MKKAIKIALTTMVILCMMLATMHWFKSHQEEKRLIRQEQERMVEYTLENYEDVRKIEFTSFEQNFSTRFWKADAIINDTFEIGYSTSNLGENQPISSIYNLEELKIKKDKKQKSDKDNIEVIYWKG